MLFCRFQQQSNFPIFWIVRARKNNGRHVFLIDRFIAANSNKNLVLDFEGSNDSKLSRFYKGFGAKECVYLQARINKLPWFIRWYKR